MISSTSATEHFDPAATMKSLELFQIFYSPETRALLDPFCKPLDNSNSTRPDWFEVYPMTNLLEQIDWNRVRMLGVLSPRFKEKTGLSLDSVAAFEFACQGEPDVLIFSPQPDMGAFFLNVFEQGETFDPGFLGTSQAVVEKLGFDVDLRSLVMDSRNIVFSNYFVANKSFWERWMQVISGLYELAESVCPIGQQLRRPTSYPGGVEVKVFLAERIASLILATEVHWKVRAHNPFRFAWSTTRFRENPNTAYINDALKIAYRDTGRREYLDAFAHVRQRFINRGVD
jgi:hypothetical protein